MKRSILIAGILIATTLFMDHSLYAGRGAIPFRPLVRIHEPRQRVVIACNAGEEILLLSTDLRAERPTKVLEVMPFPSEPEIKKGDVETFNKAVHLINRKLPRRRRRPRPPHRSAVVLPIPKLKPVPELRPAGMVTFREKIGAHDISVLHVLKTKGFVRWVERYLKSAGVNRPKIPPNLRFAIIEYLREGFTWFVFDVIELDEELRTTETIQYRFKTDFLYYPLRISQTEEGYTNIDLLILTRRLLRKFHGIPRRRVQVRRRPATVAPSELFYLNEDMAELFGYDDYVRLRAWRIHGRLAGFDEDLIVTDL